MYQGLIMREFNPYILLVMRWLQNNDSVSEKELEANFHLAYAASIAADTAAYAAAATAAAIDAVGDADDAKYWLIETKEFLDKYFELTKEDRQAYENRAKYLNVLGANNA